MQINLITINLDPNAGTGGGGGGTPIVPTIELQDKELVFNSNGTQMVTPDAGYDGMSSVKVTVNSPDAGQIVLPNGICLKGSSFAVFDGSNYDVSLIREFNNMFQLCPLLTSLNATGWNTSNGTDMNSMFDNCSVLESITGISDWNTSNVTNMYQMFNHCEDLTSLDLSNWDTRNVTDMGFMFSGCNSLTPIGLANWNTSKVTNMGNMFSNCNSLTSLDLSGWDTSNVTGMYSMFLGCTHLATISGIENWDTSNVTSMRDMFNGCSSLAEIRMRGDVSKVTNVTGMFSSVKSGGTFYYNPQYDYSKIIAELPATWTAVPMN